MFPGLPAGPLTDAMDELQRALIWEADNAEFLDADLNSAGLPARRRSPGPRGGALDERQRASLGRSAQLR